MQCLRCGREIEENAVFCGECLAEMEKHPVKPHTMVHIPNRELRNRNQPPRRPQKNEEQQQLLEQKLGKLRLLVCMLTVALVLCIGWITWQELTQENGPAIGQNYTSIVDWAQGGR